MATIDVAIDTYVIPDAPTAEEITEHWGTKHITVPTYNTYPIPVWPAYGQWQLSWPIIFHTMGDNTPIIFRARADTLPVIFYSAGPRRYHYINVGDLEMYDIPSIPTKTVVAAELVTAQTISKTETTYVVPDAPTDTEETGTSQYPTQDADHVKATTTRAGDYYPYNATNPAESLTGAMSGNGWCANANQQQRLHIDLGSAMVIQGIYYENSHDSGGETDMGAKTFTVWGSNTAAAFADLVYTHDVDWTAITASASTFTQHTASDAADAELVTLSNNIAYQYYALKIVDNWGDASYLGLRRIELRSFA